MKAFYKLGRAFIPELKQNLSHIIRLYSTKTGQIFADPTYDNTFKILFASQKHLKITLSILNSFLNFTGDREITSVSFPSKNTDLNDSSNAASIVSSALENDTRFAVDSTVDLLCITKNGEQIAIEMQRAHEGYFLARTQLYMAKLIASQVKVGESAKAHKVMLDTYIICIGKENIFRDPVILSKQKAYLNEDTKEELSFELTVTPTIHDLWVTVQDNKMIWKFFELTKFKEYMQKFSIQKDSPIKHQWLQFLLKCHEAEDTPENIAEIIKEGYDIMRMSNWSPEQKVLYDIEIDKEELARTKVQEAEIKGKIEGEAIGLKKGKIEIIKSMLESRMDLSNVSEISKTPLELAEFIQGRSDIDALELLSSHGHLLGAVQDDAIDHPG